MKRIDVRTSKIHGKGVFALEPIQRGEVVGRFLSRRTNRKGPHTLWVLNNGAWRGYEGLGRLRFVNYSRRPNAEFRGRDLYALRKIPPGDEITVEYGMDWS